MKYLKSLIYLSLFILLITFSSCLFTIKKGELPKSLIDNVSKSQNPFHGGERVTFVSSINEKVDIIAQQRDNFMSEFPRGSEIYNVEYDRQSINSLDKKYRISLSMSAESRYVTLGVSIDWDTVAFGFLNNMPMDTTNTPYVDSLLVMGNWEKNVFYSESNYNSVLKYMYYSPDYGVIEFMLQDGIVWKLESIVLSEE